MVDDHDFVRESLKKLLEKDNVFSVVCQCENGADAIENATIHQPDIILMDINMTPINGFEATKKILEANPSARVIGLSINNIPNYATKMISLGAKGYVTKSSTFDELKNAIQKVHDGENYICQEIKKKLPPKE